MGESKINEAKRYRMQLSASERYALYTAFLNATDVKERQERRAYADAWDALGFDDYHGLRVGIPKDDSAAEERRVEDAFNAILDRMGGTWIVPIETVRKTLSVIEGVFKSGSLRGFSAQRLHKVESLCEACQRGENVYEAAPPTAEAPVNGAADGSTEAHA